MRAFSRVSRLLLSDKALTRLQDSPATSSHAQRALNTMHMSSSIPVGSEAGPGTPSAAGVDTAAQAKKSTRASVLAAIGQTSRRSSSTMAGPSPSASGSGPLSERDPNTLSPVAAKTPVTASKRKAVDPADEAEAEEVKKAAKPALSRQESERRREVELTELEKGMEAYDWRDPIWPVTSSGKPRIVYISNRFDAGLNGLLTALGKRPSYTDEQDPICLGFDMEWEVSFRRGAPASLSRTALIQICSRSLILILHIAHLVPAKADSKPPLPEALEKLLRRPDIQKTGVNIDGDFLKLNREFSQRNVDVTELAASTSSGRAEGSKIPERIQALQAQGILELSTLAKEVDPERWAGKRLISLRELVAVYLGRKLLKDATRTSKWAQSKLSPDQLKYAASDVLSGLEVHEALRRRAKAKKEAPDQPLSPLPVRRDYEDITREGLANPVA